MPKAKDRYDASRIMEIVVRVDNNMCLRVLCYVNLEGKDTDSVESGAATYLRKRRQLGT